MNSLPKVGLFYTCLVDTLKPNVAKATVKLVESADFKVVIPENQTCCGRPAFNSGNRRLSREIAKQSIRQFEAFDYVVGPSGSCLSMFVKHYPDLLKGDANWHRRALALSKKSFDLVDFLVNVADLPKDTTKYHGVVTYHDSCTGLRELGIKNQPRELLSRVEGLELVEMETAETCCGFGGAFSVKFPEISTRLVDDKVKSILKTGADTVVGGDLGCLMNIFGRLHRMKKSIRVFHIAEILAGMTHDGPLGSTALKMEK
jgi:L-lactate dehydrogenase complex protein LldE